MTTRFETAITNRAAAAIAAAAGRPGPAASTARAWIDSMTGRLPSLDANWPADMSRSRVSCCQLRIV